MSSTKDLQKLGLTETEAKVYLAVLQLNGGYVSSISRRSDVERTNCYHTLKTLSKKGLISISNQGNVQYYMPETPKKFIHEQEDKLYIAQKIVPELLKMQSATPGLAPKMKYFEGKAAVSNLMKQTLQSETEILRYTNVKALMDKFENTLEEYCRKQAEKNIKSRIISPHHADAENFLVDFFPKAYIESSIQLLYINPKEFYLENDVAIFDDKVSIISLNPNENIGVIIESQVYADTSRTTFNLSWLGATSFIAQ